MLVILLPVLWAIVSCGIALVLYKTSKSVFEGDSLLGVPAKKIRLTGSVVIAVIVFLLIKQATPRENLLALPKGSAILTQDQKRNVIGQSQELEAVLMDLNGCLQMAREGPGCSDDAHRARVLSAALTGQLKRLGQ